MCEPMRFIEGAHNWCVPGV